MSFPSMAIGKMPCDRETLVFFEIVIDCLPFDGFLKETL